MIEFHADFIAFEDAEDYWLVAFADQERHVKQYLMFQRAHEFDEQDRATGMDSYYVERDDQAYSGYGGVARVDLHPDRIVVRLDDTGERHLDARSVTVTFARDGRRFGKLRRRLDKIFQGTSCLVVHPE